MNRRSVLASVGSLGLVGVAGCSDLASQVQEQARDPCSPPDTSDLGLTLPEEGGGFTLKSWRGGSRGDAVDAAIGEYTREGSDEVYMMGVYEYRSNEKAVEVSRTTDEGPMTDSTGTVVVEKWLFYATAPDEETARNLIVQNEALSEDCVDEKFEFGGSGGGDATETTGDGETTEAEGS